MSIPYLCNNSCEKVITRKQLPEMNKALTEKNERRDFYFLASY